MSAPTLQLFLGLASICARMSGVLLNCRLLLNCFWGFSFSDILVIYELYSTMGKYRNNGLINWILMGVYLPPIPLYTYNSLFKYINNYLSTWKWQGDFVVEGIDKLEILMALCSVRYPSLYIILEWWSWKIIAVFS